MIVLLSYMIPPLCIGGGVVLWQRIRKNKKKILLRTILQGITNERSEWIDDFIKVALLSRQQERSLILYLNLHQEENHITMLLPFTYPLVVPFMRGSVQKTTAVIVSPQGIIQHIEENELSEKEKKMFIGITLDSPTTFAITSPQHNYACVPFRSLKKIINQMIRL